jgi:outer membrane protein TolC
MRGLRDWWRCRRAALLSGVVAPTLFALTGAADWAAPEKLAEPAAVPTAPAAAVVAADLATLRRLALEKQPALAAYRASLAAAETRLQGLNDLKLIGLVRPDLKTRKQQAAEGIRAAEARLHQAEWSSVYAVTRNYWSVVYAQSQRRLADVALEKEATGGEQFVSLYQLRELGRITQDGLPDGRKHEAPTWAWRTQVDALIGFAESRRVEAARGRERALSALREAVGLGEDCPLVVSESVNLPDIHLTLSREQVVSLALARRGEIVQAEAGVEVTALEAHAQSLSIFPRAETFAAGSDIHAEQPPQGLADGEYRPGAIGLEMPGVMVGKRSTRVQQANDLNDRAASVLEKAKNLIRLEVEDAFLRWQEATERLERLAPAEKEMRQAAATATKEFLARPNEPKTLTTFNDLLAVRERYLHIRLQLNQARYLQLLALADLERMTSGGVCPGFEGAPAGAAQTP